MTTADQWDRNREGYELFRLLWESESVTWSGRFRPSLVNAKALPRPLQSRIRIWHGSATSTDSVDLAARHGDPIFSANVSNPVEPYAELVRHYRERWKFYGHRPEDALVGAGTAGFYVTPTSQEAVATYRPMFEARLAFTRRAGIPAVFESIEDFIERSSALVGSPRAGDRQGGPLSRAARARSDAPECRCRRCDGRPTTSKFRTVSVRGRTCSAGTHPEPTAYLTADRAEEIGGNDHRHVLSAIVGPTSRRKPVARVRRPDRGAPPGQASAAAAAQHRSARG